MNLQENKELLELFKSTGELESAESAVSREAFAAALKLPLNREIEKANLARTLFATDKLAPGAQATYPVDIDPINAWVLPRIGAAPQNLVGVEEINVPLFEVTNSIEWKLQLARQGRINIVQRKTLSLRNSIVKLENAAAWGLIRAAVSGSRTVNSSQTSLTKTAYNEGFQMMTSMDDYKVDLVVVNAKRAGDIRDWGSNVLDPTTMREVWKQAGVGNIWGADIIIENDLADNELFLFDTSKMGAMPIRQDFVTYDDPTAIRTYRQRVLGYQEIGFVVFDADAIVRVTLTV